MLKFSHALITSANSSPKIFLLYYATWLLGRPVTLTKLKSNGIIFGTDPRRFSHFGTKGEQRGLLKGKLETIPLLKKLGLSIAEIVEELDIDLALVNQFVANQNN